MENNTHEITKRLLGPEVIWLSLYILARIISKLNAAPPHGLDKFIENWYLWVPLAALLTFSLWHFPGVEKNWLLLRVWLVCLIGGHLVLDAGLRGYSQQGPGIGTAYIFGWLLMFFALVAGTIYAKIRF